MPDREPTPGRGWYVLLKLQEIKYSGLGDHSKIKVVVYADGSHGSLPSGASQGGSIMFLEGNRKSVPFFWRSKIERITFSYRNFSGCWWSGSQSSSGVND